MTRVLLSVVIASLAIGAPLSAQHARVALPATPFDSGAVDTTAARRLAGCYAVETGSWSEPRANGGHIPMPERLDLQMTPGGASRRFALTAATRGFVVSRGRSDAPAWSPVGGDSLQLLVWTDGLSSVDIFARRRPDGTLRGTARYFTDAILLDANRRWMWERYPMAAVRMTPRSCTANAG